MRAAEELEHLYERKLAAEAARWEALRKDKEDMQCELEERIYALVVAGQEREERLKLEREEIKAAADQKLVASEEQQAALAHKYEEMLSQEERDNDTVIERQEEAAFKLLTHEREEKQTRQRHRHREAGGGGVQAAHARARGEADDQGRAGDHAQKVRQLPAGHGEAQVTAG